MQTTQDMIVPAQPPALTDVLERRVIDWDYLLEQRQTVLDHSELPPYLLLPEIHRLIDAASHDNVRLMLMTLWLTGARISECLALTRSAFVLDVAQPYVSLHTLKGRGRPKKGGRAKPRLVPIADQRFIDQLRRYFKTHGVGKAERLFPITRDAANKRIARLLAQLPAEQRPRIRVSPHTWRHYLPTRTMSSNQMGVA